MSLIVCVCDYARNVISLCLCRSFLPFLYLSLTTVESDSYLGSRTGDDRESTSTCSGNEEPQCRLPPGTGH